MKAFRVTAIRTEKAPDEWPFFTIAYVIVARDIGWAEEIAKETLGMMEMIRGAYHSMRIDEITEIHVGGM